MKKMFLPLLISIVLVGIYQVRQFRVEQKIISAFNAHITQIVEKMNIYDQLDLRFLEKDLDTIPLSIKKNPEVHITLLQAGFRNAIINYNASKGVWTKEGLPVALDTDELLQTMTLEQKVAQLFLFGFDGTILSPGEKSFLLDYQPGGVILMGDNISPQLSQTIDDLQATQKILPLFVSIDQEGGVVTRIDEKLPSQPDVGLENICDTYTARSDRLHELGINMNFGIVADATTNPDSFIYPRVFRGDVGAKVTEAVKCAHTTLSTIKHWPGHGATALDTHLGAATLTITKSTREDLHLPPFVAGISAGTDLIMVGHLIAQWLDPELPSTLSRSHYQFLNSLGFHGLTITDDMLMISTISNRQTHLEQALSAGNNLLLYVDPNQIGKTKILDHAIQFVREGNIDPNDLDTRVRKIIEKKQKIISWDQYVPLELMKLIAH